MISSMAMSMREGTVVKLRHSGSDKVVELVVTQDSKLDMGSIAATFGLNPLNLKLNGLYISRGPDCISSSLTWNDVLRYFANKGYPTGISHQHPIIVDGSACQGSCFNFSCSENLNSTNPEAVAIGDKRKVLWEDSTSANTPKKRKTIEDNVGSCFNFSCSENLNSTNPEAVAIGDKRKVLWEDFTSANTPKKRKTIEDNVGTNDKHSQYLRGKYNKCYTKRGRDEDPGELHSEEKKRRSLYACDVHSKSCADEKKIEWDGGSYLSV